MYLTCELSVRTDELKAVRLMTMDNENELDYDLMNFSTFCVNISHNIKAIRAHLIAFSALAMTAKS